MRLPWLGAHHHYHLIHFSRGWWCLNMSLLAISLCKKKERGRLGNDTTPVRVAVVLANLISISARRCQKKISSLRRLCHLLQLPRLICFPLWDRYPETALSQQQQHHQVIHTFDPLLKKNLAFFLSFAISLNRGHDFVRNFSKLT